MNSNKIRKLKIIPENEEINVNNNVKYSQNFKKNHK